MAVPDFGALNFDRRPVSAIFSYYQVMQIIAPNRRLASTIAFLATVSFWSGSSSNQTIFTNVAPDQGLPATE